MSEGRFFLGLGTSGRLVIEDLHGEKFDKPLTRMREYIDIVRKAARGERLDHDGEFFHTKRFQLRFPPYRASLPIYIAALSPPSLRLTGELADGWLPIFLAPSRMTAAVAELEAGAKAAGRSWRDVVISPQVSIYVTADVAAARDRERPHIAFYIGGMGVFYHEYMHRIGFGADADRVREAFQARDRDRAAQLVTDEMVDAMTIIGEPEACRKQMQAFFDAGVQEIRARLQRAEQGGLSRGAEGGGPGSRPMKVGVLQFFSWSRRIPLATVYERALSRIEVMDRTGLRLRLARRAPLQHLQRVSVDQRHGDPRGGADASGCASAWPCRSPPSTIRCASPRRSR